MPGFAIGGRSLADGANVAVRGVRPAGLALRGTTIWRATAGPTLPGANITVNWDPPTGQVNIGDQFLLIAVGNANWDTLGWEAYYVTARDENIRNAPNAIVNWSQPIANQQPLAPPNVIAVRGVDTGFPGAWGYDVPTSGWARWYRFTGTWAPPPVQSITSVGLSQTTFNAAVASGTTVSAVNVTMSSGTFSGSLSLAGTDAGRFNLVGNQLQTQGAPEAPRNYSISITASQAPMSPVTQGFTLNAVAVAPPPEGGFVFSLEEQPIEGETWTDGRQIYVKTVPLQLTPPPTAGVSHESLTPHHIHGIHFVINMIGVIRNAGGTNIMLPYPQAAPVFHNGIALDLHEGNIVVRSSLDLPGLGYAGFVTLWYVK